MGDTNTNTGTIALLDAIAEARVLTEDVSRLAEELKVREERLERLLVPSETALRARSEYLEKVLRQELGESGRRVMRLCEDVESLSRALAEHVRETTSRLEAMDRERERTTRTRDRWRAAIAIVLLLTGGFLAGELAQYRARVADTGRAADTTTAVTLGGEEPPTSARIVKPKPVRKPAR